MLPSTLIIPFSAAIAGILMTRFAQFKYLNALGCLFLVSGTASLSTLRVDPARGQQIGFQILYAIGGGILFPGRLMAVQASQVEEDIRMATALVSFGTSLGQALGVAMGSTAFQNEWNSLVDHDVRNGKIPQRFRLNADQAAKAAEIIATFPSVTVREAYREIMALSTARIWVICAALAGTAFVAAALFSRNLSLHKEPKGTKETVISSESESESETVS